MTSVIPLGERYNPFDPEVQDRLNKAVEDIERLIEIEEDLQRVVREVPDPGGGEAIVPPQTDMMVILGDSSENEVTPNIWEYWWTQATLTPVYDTSDPPEIVDYVEPWIVIDQADDPIDYASEGWGYAYNRAEYLNTGSHVLHGTALVAGPGELRVHPVQGDTPVLMHIDYDPLGKRHLSFYAVNRTTAICT